MRIDKRFTNTTRQAAARACDWADAAVASLPCDTQLAARNWEPVADYCANAAHTQLFAGNCDRAAQYAFEAATIVAEVIAGVRQ